MSWMWVLHLGRSVPEALLSSHGIRSGGTRFHGPFAVDVDLGHLITVVCGKLLHWKITLFPFVVKMFLLESDLRLWKYSVLHQTVTH